jgi:hypothetical protein
MSQIAWRHLSTTPKFNKFKKAAWKKHKNFHYQNW